MFSGPFEWMLLKDEVSKVEGKIFEDAGLYNALTFRTYPPYEDGTFLRVIVSTMGKKPNSWKSLGVTVVRKEQFTPVRLPTEDEVGEVMDQLGVEHWNVKNFNSLKMPHSWVFRQIDKQKLVEVTE